jgi:hypothetical protein
MEHEMKIAALVLAAALASACNLFPDSSSSSASSTSPSSTAITNTFSGTLSAQGAPFFTFAVTTAGTVTVNLTSLSPSPAAGVGLGIGVPNGTTSCTLSASTNTAVASSTAQLTATLAAGNYCAEVYDPGGLSTTTNFTITVTHT